MRSIVEAYVRSVFPGQVALVERVVSNCLRLFTSFMPCSCDFVCGGKSRGVGRGSGPVQYAFRGFNPTYTDSHRLKHKNWELINLVIETVRKTSNLFNEV